MHQFPYLIHLRDLKSFLSASLLRLVIENDTEVRSDKSAVVFRGIAFPPIARVSNTRLLVNSFIENITSRKAASQ
jgi:hypothetical protein